MLFESPCIAGAFFWAGPSAQRTLPKSAGEGREPPHATAALNIQPRIFSGRLILQSRHIPCSLRTRRNQQRCRTGMPHCGATLAGDSTHPAIPVPYRQRGACGCLAVADAASHAFDTVHCGRKHKLRRPVFYFRHPEVAGIPAQKAGSSTACIRLPPECVRCRQSSVLTGFSPEAVRPPSGQPQIAEKVFSITANQVLTKPP